MENFRKVAFITTPNFRKEYDKKISAFIRSHLYRLSQRYRIVCTGNTFIDTVQKEFQKEFLALSEGDKEDIRKGMRLAKFSASNFETWQTQLRDCVEAKRKSAPGVVEILVELVEGRLAGVIHLTHPEDVEAKADSSVLWREANVHNIPIAHDVTTAASFIDAWQNAEPQKAKDLKPGELLSSALNGLNESDNTLALIAHDGKKMELCQFVIEHADRIGKYDSILATGTTGEKLKEFLNAHNPQWPISKIKQCYSGPKGGDIQIAYAIIQGFCRKVIFFQDPATSHPHEVDIRLFEKILLDSQLPVQLATNRSAAELIL